MANTEYRNRRYLVVDGKLKKSWTNPPPPGWFVVKADAWADHAEKIAKAKAFDEALAAKKAVKNKASDTPAPPKPKRRRRANPTKRVPRKKKAAAQAESKVT